MLVTITKQHLLGALQRATATTATDSSHPATATLHLTTDEGLITVSSTNLTASTVTSVPANVSRAGTAVVQAQKLNQIVAAFEDDDDVSLNLTQKSLIVAQRSRRYEVRVHDPKSFPTIAIMRAESDAITLSSNSLSQVFDRVARFADPETNVLAGIYFRTSQGTLEALAFSGKSNARATIAIDPATPDRAWFIPVSFYKAARMLFNQSDVITIGASQNYIALESDHYVTGTRLPNGVEPNLIESLQFARTELIALENPVVAMGTNGVIVHPTQLASAINAVAIGVGKGSFSPIKLDVYGQILRLTGEESEGDCGLATDTVPMLGMAPDKPELDIDVNSYYLTEILKSIGSLTEKQVVMRSLSINGMETALLGISIGSGYKEFGSATYLVCPLNPTPREPETKEEKKPKASKGKK